MKIHVHFYAQLRDVAGVSDLSLDVAEAASVADVLEELYRLKPMVREHDKNILIGAGVDFVERDHLLTDGEELAIMPPVQGG